MKSVSLFSVMKGLSTGSNYPGNISEDLEAIIWRKRSEYYWPYDMVKKFKYVLYIEKRKQIENHKKN